MSDEPVFGADELAERAGVSRRTVRYYVQRGLLPPPLGLGRGKHYTEGHLATLVRIRELQENNVPLDDIAARLRGPEPEPERVSVECPAPQSTWTRVALSEDVEVHVRGRRLSEEQVRELSRLVARIVGVAS